MICVSSQEHFYQPIHLPNHQFSILGDLELSFLKNFDLHVLAIFSFAQCIHLEARLEQVVLFLRMKLSRASILHRSTANTTNSSQKYQVRIWNSNTLEQLHVKWWLIELWLQAYTKSYETDSVKEKTIENKKQYRIGNTEWSTTQLVRWIRMILQALSV
jgi:hypothetical protein